MQGARQISEIARSNVNVNEFLFKRNNVNNVNVNVRNSIVKADHVEWIADKLVQEFSDASSKRFFAKIAWSLPENEIWEALESAKRPCIKSPVKYFTRICKIKLRQIGK